VIVVDAGRIVVLCDRRACVVRLDLAPDRGVNRPYVRVPGTWRDAGHGVHYCPSCAANPLRAIRTAA
jgi:hypothetical protein